MGVQRGSVLELNNMEGRLEDDPLKERKNTKEKQRMKRFYQSSTVKIHVVLV